MKKFIFALLLVAVSYSPLIQANLPECEPETNLGEDILGFLVVYRIANDAPYLLPLCLDENGGLTAEVLATFDGINKSLITHIEQDAVPIPIKADMQLWVKETAKKQFADFPTFSGYIKAYRNDKGNVVMDMTMPAYTKKPSDNSEDRQITIDFQGIEGSSEMVPSNLWHRIAKKLKNDEEITLESDESMILDLYKTITFDVKLPRILVNVEDKFYFLLENIKFEGEYDEKLSPNWLNFTLPTIQVGEGNSVQAGKDSRLIIMQDIDFKLNSRLYQLPTKVAMDLKVGTFGLNIASIVINHKPLIKQFWLKTKATKPTTTIDYTIATKIDSLTLPKIGTSKALDMHYTGNWTFKRIDTETLAKFQKTMTDLQRKQFTGKLFSSQMVGIVIMGQMMQSLPRLINKSPELSLSDFNLTTEKGKLQGQATLKLDSRKSPSLANPSSFFTALKGEAKFNMDKTLLAYLLNAWNNSNSADLPSAETQIQQLLEDKWLVKSGKQLQLQLDLAEGKLHVNGVEKSIR